MGTMLISLGLAVGYLLVAPRWYSSTALIQIDLLRSNPLQQERGSGGARFDSNIVDTEAEILKSEAILRTVIEEIGSTKKSDGPMVTSLEAILARIPGFETLRLWIGSLRAPSDENQSDNIDQLEEVIDVKRMGQTFILAVTSEALSPEEATALTETLVRVYLSKQMSARTESAQQASEWMESRLLTLRRTAEDAERALQRARTSNDIIESRVELAELENTAKTHWAVYNIFLQRLTESALQMSFPITESRLASPASVARKSRPRSVIVLSLAGILGAAVGTFFALVRHYRLMTQPLTQRVVRQAPPRRQIQPHD